MLCETASLSSAAPLVIPRGRSAAVTTIGTTSRIAVVSLGISTLLAALKGPRYSCLGGRRAGLFDLRRLGIIAVRFGHEIEISVGSPRDRWGREPGRANDLRPRSED